MEQLVFYLFGSVAVVAALLVVLQKKAVYSALALIVCFTSLAVLFFQLGAYFIGAIQIIIYAGAIMVLFLFVVMLIDPESEVFSANGRKHLIFIALPMSALLGLILFWAVSRFEGSESVTLDVIQSSKGEVGFLAQHLFSDYLLPFEVTSILILVAVLGAMVLVKRTD